MKLKQVIKYQLLDFRNAYLVFFGIILLLSFIGRMDGAEMTFAVFVFVVGLCSFSENFHMLIQNGISRKTMFLGRITAVVITGIIMAVMNEILALIQLFRGFREQYLLTIYGSTLNGSSEFVQTGLSRPLFAMCLVLAAMMFGYFLAILFYRSGKAGRLCIAAGLPVFTFVVLPPLVVFYRNTPFMQGLWKFFRLILGLDNGNPFYLIGTCVVVFLLFSVFSFLLMRKVPLRR